MFASNALPLPTPFGHEHRPLRLTSESSQAQPHGGCHYRTSSVQNNRCMCQTYQHDRRAPGNICDCGHKACYHSASASANGEALSSERIIAALAEKIRTLEEYIVKDKENRKDDLSREREREARALREALSPFYLSEQDMRRKLMHLKEQVDVCSNEHLRLEERVSAIDAISANLERHVQTWEDARGRKRKASLSVPGRVVMSPDSNYTSASSAESDIYSSSENTSPQSASPVNPSLRVGTVVPSPRSSGVLTHRAPSTHDSKDRSHLQRQSQGSGASGEPRSSGFLSIDLAQRMRKKQPSPVGPEERLLPVRSLSIRDQNTPSASESLRLPAPPQQSKASSGALPVSRLLSNSPTRPDADTRLAKKRKQQDETMALDVLANASMSRPLTHAL